MPPGRLDEVSILAGKLQDCSSGGAIQVKTKVLEVLDDRNHDLEVTRLLRFQQDTEGSSKSDL